MRNVNKAQEILRKYNEALETNDMLTMLECIEEMKETDPVFVELMINAYEDDEE